MEKISTNPYPSQKSSRSILSAENFQSELLPQITAGVAAHTKSGIRAVHIVSPHSIGKSVELVPNLWQHIKKKWPSKRGSYIQAIAYKARSLFEYYEQSTFRDMSALNRVDFASDPNGGSEKLILSFYEALERDLIQQLDAPQPEPPTAPLVLFIDLETVPTVRGEILLGLLITYLSKLASTPTTSQTNHPSIDITIITLSSSRDTRVYDAFEHFLAAENRPLIAKLPETSIRKHRANGKIMGEISSTIIEAIKGDFITYLEREEEVNPAPCLLAFMSRPDATHLLALPLRKTLQRELVPHSLDYSSKAKEIKQVIELGGPKIICVDHSFPVVLASHITHAMSLGYKNVQTFDRNSSQFVPSKVCLSCDELDKETAWAEASSSADVNFFITYDKSWTRSQIPKSPLDGNLIYLAYKLVNYWGNSPLHTIPVPLLPKIDPEKLTEMLRRLQAMSCISRVPGGGWKRKASDLHILIANILDKQYSLSNKTKRVLVRLASIISGDLPSLLFLDLQQVSDLGLQMNSSVVPLLLSYIRKDSAGVGKQQVQYGSLWIALGLWQNRWSQHGDFKTERASEIPCANSVVKMSKRHCVDISTMVLKLESYLKLAPLSFTEEIEGTKIDAAELAVVNELLLMSYMHQQIVFPYVKDMDTFDLVSGQPIDGSNSTANLLDVDTLRNKGGDQLQGGFTAIYTAIHRVQGILVPQDLTLMPNQAHAHLKSILGLPLSAALRTTYPVPTPE
ncbi:hypothetical protein AB5N19_02197 [Seiridium cardinale]